MLRVPSTSTFPAATIENTQQFHEDLQRFFASSGFVQAFESLYISQLHSEFVWNGLLTSLIFAIGKKFREHRYSMESPCNCSNYIISLLSAVAGRKYDILYIANYKAWSTSSLSDRTETQASLCAQMSFMLEKLPTMKLYHSI